MAIDLRDALTRKLGPLPAWAWGGVIGVGALAYRTLHGGGASASSGTSRTIGGDGAGFDYGDLPDLGGGSGSDGTPTTTIGGDTLPGIVGVVGSAFTLQQQLNGALAKLSALIGQRSTVQQQKNANLDAYRAHKISKATYTKRNTAYTKQLADIGGQITATNSLIADLKAKLSAIFAAPAAA